MAIRRFINLNIPEAQLLADLTGIRNDLDAVAEICDLLLVELSKSQPNWKILEAFTSAALVRYVRSFNSGVRAGISKLIFQGISNEQLADHKWFKDLRDKFVAHSVNAFEENQVVAYLVPEEKGPRAVSSISVQQNRLASFGTDDINRLKGLCSVFREKVASLIEVENQKVLDAAKVLPVDEIYNQVDSPPKVATRGDVATTRKRLDF